jgi:hypothetical protein
MWNRPERILSQHTKAISSKKRRHQNTMRNYE